MIKCARTIKYLGISLFLLALILCFDRINVYAQGGSFFDDYKLNKESLLANPHDIEVDSMGNIYIATSFNINVYSYSGEFLHAIQVSLSRGSYYMKIDDEDRLHVAINDRNLLIFNSNGILIEKKDIDNFQLYNEFKENNTIAKDSKGNIYQISNHFGNTKVVKIEENGERTTLISIRFKSLLMKLLFPASIFMFILTVGLIVFKNILKMK